MAGTEAHTWETGPLYTIIYLELDVLQAAVPVRLSRAAAAARSGHSLLQGEGGKVWNRRSGADG
jgi:hypothetical protein